jgi:ParB/RepB/Spo0J family partition protein
MPEYRTVDISQIRSRPTQVRQEFDAEFIEELASSIRREGVIVPIIVRRAKSGFEIVAGEQRWRAAKKAGVKQVPVAVIEADEKRVLELAFVENVKRKDLGGWEREEAIARMWESGSYRSLEDLAKVLDYKKEYVQGILTARRLRKEENLPKGASTRLIVATAPADPATRRAIIDATETGEIPKDIPLVTKLVSISRQAPESARQTIVRAVAKEKMELEEAGVFARVVNNREEAEDLLKARKSLSPKEFKATLSYVAREKESGRSPVLREVLKGDVVAWSAVVETFRSGYETLQLIRPESLKGIGKEFRKELLDLVYDLQERLRRMIEALED